MDDTKGFIEYKGKTYPFSFSDFHLDLYPDNFNSRFTDEGYPSYERGDVISSILLRGTTWDRKDVIFEVSELYSDQDGFLSFNVYSVYEYSSIRRQYYEEDGRYKHNNIKTKIMGMKISGNDVNLFYPPEKAFLKENLSDEEIISAIKVKRSAEASLGSIVWEEKRIDFTAQYKVAERFSPEPLRIISEITASFSEEVPLDFVKEVYGGIIQTFKYITRRNNIAFDDIEVFDVTEKNQRYTFGKFCDLRSCIEKEQNPQMKERVLSYNYIGEKFAELVKAFLERIIYIDHLPDNIDQVNFLGPDRMFFDFVAFERECANLYPEKTIRSEQYMEAKEKALAAMDSLIADKSGKVKKYLKAFRKRIDRDENSLEDRMLGVINDCLEIVEPFLIYELGADYNTKVDEITPLENIASEMNVLRNDMAHGNLNIQLNKNHIAGFAVIETLLYAMRLKALGIEKCKIQEGIISIIGYKITGIT